MDLVIGASGQLGSRVTRRLLASGRTVRAQSRNPAIRLAELTELGAIPVAGDLREDDWIDAALDGVEHLVIASQGAFPPSRTNHAGTVDEPGNRRLIGAAQRARVEHIVFLSSCLAAPDFPNRFIRAKFVAEQLLQSNGVTYTILRPPVFTEVHALFMMGEPLRSGQKVPVFGSGTTPLRWISVEDVADCVVNAFDDPAAKNAIWTIGGPDVMSRLQALEVMESRLGTQANRRHVPVPLMRAMRVLTKPLNPGLSDVISFALAEERGEHEGFAPSQLDWTGPRTVDDVVREWAGDRQPEQVAAG